MSDEDTVFSGAQRADDFNEDVAPALAPPVAPFVPKERAGDAVADEAVRGAEPVRPTPAPTPVAELVDPARLLAAASSPTGAASKEGSGRARQGWRGALARVGLPVGPGAQEQAAIARAREVEAARTVIRQATWTRAVSVLVGNPKGGTGKTPISLLLGGVMASVRGGDVVVVEVADDPGALGYRCEGTPSLGLGEFVRDVGNLHTKGQVAGYTAPQTSFASVVGTVEGQPRPPLTYAEVVQVAAKLDEHFEIRVMDSGNQPSSGAFKAAAETADVLVIPVMNAGDSTLEALGMLRELRASEAGRRLAQNAIAVVTDDGRPQDPRMKETVPQALASAGVRIIHQLPYDEHIASRGEVTLGHVNQGATEALTLLAADVIRGLTSAAVPRGHRVQTIATTKETHR